MPEEGVLETTALDRAATPAAVEATAASGPVESSDASRAYGNGEDLGPDGTAQSADAAAPDSPMAADAPAGAVPDPAPPDPSATPEAVTPEAVLPATVLPAAVRPGTSAPAAEQLAAWKELTLLSFQALADHAIHCGGNGVDILRDSLHETIARLKQDPAPSQVLVSAGAVSEAITHFGADAQLRVDALRGQVSSIVDPFLDYLESAQDDRKSLELLAGLRQEVGTHLAAAEISRARDALLERLPELLARAKEVRAEARELTGKLQDRVTVLEQSNARAAVVSAPPSVAAPAPAISLDPCTGLPVRAEAEAAIQRAIASEPAPFLAVFYLHRMALTNARFGESIGEQVILFCSQHIATNVTRGSDSLFRWTGPAFVALLERADALLTVNAEVQRVVSAPVSRFFETSSRSVYLPIKITAEVFSLTEKGVAEATDEIHQFVLKASGAPTD